ncbi:MAG: hypothetical protein Q8P12_08050 [bacterium]|nr:hypothetical protein [bacterium]
MVSVTKGTQRTRKPRFKWEGKIVVTTEHPGKYPETETFDGFATRAPSESKARSNIRYQFMEDKGFFPPNNEYQTHKVFVWRAP